MKKLICGVLVTVFSIVGLAALADHLDSNIHGEAVVGTDFCNGNGVHCTKKV